MKTKTRWFGVQYVEPHKCDGLACEHVAEYLGLALVKAADATHAVNLAASLGLVPHVPHMVSVAIVAHYTGEVPEAYRNRLIADKDEVIEAVDAWAKAGRS